MACDQCGSPRPPSVDEPLDETVVSGQEVVLEGKWRVQKKLGEGGMGTVYLAHDLALDRPVAIKMLAPALSRHEEVVSRFEREARLLAKLEHPNLVPIYSVGRRGTVPFIVMKYLEGQTLTELIRTRGHLQARELVPVLKQICAGLGLIHARGFVHRDVKPGNVFVGPDGHVTILDLGVAHDPDQQLTRKGLLIGTPQYMAPEQVTGTGKADSRSDLYALAAVIYELLTGEPLFSSMSEYELLRAHQDRPAPNAHAVQPEVPQAVAAVLHRALSKSPDERYQTAVELGAAFEQAVALADDEAWRLLESGAQAGVEPGFLGGPTTLDNRAPVMDPPPRRPTPRPVTPRPATPRPVTPRSRAAAEPRSAEAVRPLTPLPLTQPVEPVAQPRVSEPSLTPVVRTKTPRPRAEPKRQSLADDDGELTRQAIAAAKLNSVRRPLLVGMAFGLVIAAIGSAAAWKYLRPPEPEPLPIDAPRTEPEQRTNARRSEPKLRGAEPPPTVEPRPRTEPRPPAPARESPKPTPAPAPAEPAKVSEPKVRGAPEAPAAPPKVNGTETLVLPQPEDVPVRGAPPAPRPKKDEGELRVTTTRGGQLYWAWLEVDRVKKGATPLTLLLPAGPHELRLEREGLPPVTRTINVPAGGTEKLQVELEP